MKIRIKGRGNAILRFDVPECDGAGWTDLNREMSQPFTEHEIHVFYYWFEFLRRSEPARWSKIVRRDFAMTLKSMKSDAYVMAFEDWWHEHNHLFRRMLDIDLLELDDEKLEYFAPSAFESDSRMKVLLLNLSWPKDRLIKRFTEILNAADVGPNIKGRYFYDREYPQNCEPGGSSEGYGIYAPVGRRTRPSIELLRNSLEVYDTYQQWENGELPIRNKYQLETYISDSRSKGDELISREVHGDPIPEVQGPTVARYKKSADVLIKNVVKGFFPKYQL